MYGCCPEELEYELCHGEWREEGSCLLSRRVLHTPVVVARMMLFIMQRQRESEREDLYVSVGVMKD